MSEDFHPSRPGIVFLKTVTGNEEGSACAIWCAMGSGTGAHRRAAQASSRELAALHVTRRGIESDGGVIDGEMVARNFPANWRGCFLFSATTTFTLPFLCLLLEERERAGGLGASRRRARGVGSLLW
jgi:hypothetical protein